MRISMEKTCIRLCPNNSRPALRTVVTWSCLAALLLISVNASAACKGEAYQKRPIVVIGERAVAICLKLKVAPLAWVGRKNLWDDSSQLNAASEFLGCPGRLSGSDGKAMLERIRELAPETVYMGFSSCLYRPGIKREMLVNKFREAGIEPVMIDFSQGPAPAVRKLAGDLGVVQAGKELIRDYEKRLAAAKKRLAKVPKGIRVAVVSGSFQDTTGKVFTRLEAPGGYSDRFILKPCGAVNVAGDVLSEGATIDKGHVQMRKLDKVMAARPDLIAATGDGLAVMLRASSAFPAVFPLPLYADADPLAYPEILTRWASVLSKIEPENPAARTKSQ